MKLTFRLKDFPGHLGIPGHQGGSLPRGSSNIKHYNPKELAKIIRTELKGKLQDIRAYSGTATSSPYGVSMMFKDGEYNNDTKIILDSVLAETNYIVTKITEDDFWYKGSTEIKGVSVDIGYKKHYDTTNVLPEGFTS